MEITDVTPTHYEEVCDFVAAQTGSPSSGGARYAWLYGEQPHAPDAGPVSLTARADGRVVGHLGVLWRQVVLPGGLTLVAEPIDFHVAPSARGLTGLVLARALLDRVGVVAGFARADIMALWCRLGAISVSRVGVRWVSAVAPGRVLAHGREGKLRRLAPLAQGALLPLRFALRALGICPAKPVDDSCSLDWQTIPAPFSDVFSSEWLAWRCRDRWHSQACSPELLVATHGDRPVWWALILDHWLLGPFGRIEAPEDEDGDGRLTAVELRSLGVAGIAVDDYESRGGTFYRSGFCPSWGSAPGYHVTAGRGHEGVFEQISRVRFRYTGL